MADVKLRNDGLFPKMKRSQHDHTKLLLGSYLSRRHYTETELQKKSVSKEQMLVSQLINKETAHPNTILFSNSLFRKTFNNDSNPVQVEPYFYKFLTWVNNLQDSFKTDLSKFICPLFCHLYLDLIQGTHQQSANLLLKYYQEQKNIVESDYCSQVIKEFNCQELRSRPVIKSFRSSKYKIKVSEDSINLLKSYLATHGHVLILQVLQTWFDIEINTMIAENSDIEDNDSDVSLNYNGDTPVVQTDEEIQELQEAILSVNQQPPSVLQVNVYNSQDTATCGLINEQYGKAIVGFNTSEISVWALGGSLLQCSKINRNASTLNLTCNVSPSIQNPEEECPLSSTGAVILRGHGASVQDVKIIPQADVLLSVSQDCTMRAWRFKDYSCAAIYRGHSYPIWCLDVSIYGAYIATGSYDKSAKLWSLERIYPTRIYAGHTKDVNSITFHPNGTYFATGSADYTIRMWSISECKTVRLFPGHKGVIYTVAYSPDGKFLASGGDDKCVRIWDIAAAKQISEVNGCSKTVTDLSWSPNGRHLAACSLDGCVRVWDTDSIVRKSTNDACNLDISSVYSTGYTSLLSVNYDKNWLTCLTASTIY